MPTAVEFRIFIFQRMSWVDGRARLNEWAKTINEEFVPWFCCVAQIRATLINKFISRNPPEPKFSLISWLCFYSNAAHNYLLLLATCLTFSHSIYCCYYFLLSLFIHNLIIKCVFISIDHYICWATIEQRIRIVRWERRTREKNQQTTSKQTLWYQIWRSAYQNLIASSVDVSMRWDFFVNRRLTFFGYDESYRVFTLNPCTTLLRYLIVHTITLIFC